MNILIQILVAIAGPISVALASWFSSRKLTVIHDLVNSRLSEALAKIDRLELQREQLTGEKPTGEPPHIPLKS
jgi:hypothetical protein